MARSDADAFFAQAAELHGLDEITIDCACERACGIIDAQRQALAEAMPQLGTPAYLQPVEMWFLWGLAHELVAGTERAQVLCVCYLHRRRGLPIDRACDVTLAMLATAGEGNPLFDSIAEVGRQAGRGGGDGHFVRAVTAVRRVLDTAA